MTAITLPGQLELPTVVDHKQAAIARGVAQMGAEESRIPDGVKLAKLLRQYEERPTSETWARIQSLAAEILR